MKSAKANLFHFVPSGAQQMGEPAAKLIRRLNLDLSPHLQLASKFRPCSSLSLTLCKLVLVLCSSSKRLVIIIVIGPHLLQFK